ncbi:MAG: DNA-processing protein DprA [Marmoricola sp.]
MADPSDRGADRVARAALCRLGEPGDPRLTGLVAELGATVVYDHLRSETDASGLASDVAQRLAALDPLADLRRAAGRGIRFVVPGDDEWPGQLAALAEPEPVNGRGGCPLGLWVRGPLRLADAVQRAVAVVGSRSATSYGADAAGEIGATLGQAGHTVISGAAYGIDQAAHRGALAVRGPTIAVLACGVDRAYPAGHRQLLDYIADAGLVVSELPPGCAPTKLRFLSRNRLIAGLGCGTVVVEAAVRSGALNTATWTQRLNRPVMGVPGPVTSAPSAGVHQLIRSRDALLVTCGAEVLEAVAPMGEHLLAEPRGAERPHDTLSLLDQQVLDAVPVSLPVTLTSIARTAGLSATSVRESLLRLVEAGLVEHSRDLYRLADRTGAE